jgi:subtilisin-like proprotein convertase family protein
VNLAKNYDFPMGTLVEQNASFNVSKYASGDVNLTIPDADKDGATNIIAISTSDALTVESIQIRVNITHEQSGQLGIQLTSPEGTTSILSNINNSFLLLDKEKNGTIDGDSNLVNFVLTSNAFYGEDSEGNWTIVVIDGLAGTTGSLTNWDINILGHN